MIAASLLQQNTARMSLHFKGKKHYYPSETDLGGLELRLELGLGGLGLNITLIFSLRVTVLARAQRGTIQNQ